MTPRAPAHSRLFFRPIKGGWRLAVALSLCSFDAPAQSPGADAEPVKLESIPQNFELWQDAQGFLWQVSRQGSLGSAEASYFQAAMTLFVKGEPFTPTEGVRADGGQATDAGAKVALGQMMGPVKVMRDVWFDRERSGVRVVDTFENTGTRRESIRVEVRSAFQNPWQDLHGTDGRIIGGGSDANLGARDFGVLVKFSPAEGRHDTLFVTCSERDAARPAVSFSSNLRELTFSYDLDIEPGKRVSLVHWIVQRNLQTPADATEALRPFYQRRQLIDPRIPADLIAGVRNFDAPSFPAEGDRPVNLEALVSLNEVIEPLGVARRADDMLWITGENQLAGTANPEAVVAVKTALGERRAAIAEIAAIQGGGGVGRTPRVFLRDGRVWAGAVTAENLSMKTAEGWEVDQMRPEEISLLLLRVGKNDGRPPTGAGLFVELRSGDVLAVEKDSAEAAALVLLTPWGEDEATLGEVRSLAYASGSSAPRFRMLRRDGSMLTVFLGGETLSVSEAGGGAPPILIAPSAVSGAWRPGESPRWATVDLADEWYDLEDARSGLGGNLPDTAVLLSGNNLLSGSLAMETLNLVSGATVTPIASAEVAAIRRSIDSDSDTSPLFEIELTGGELLNGRIREAGLTIKTGDREWRVPVSHFIAYRRNGEPKKPDA